MDENNETKENTLISLKNIPNDKLLNNATIRDLILFKEDILKEMRLYESKMKSSLNDKFNKFVSEANEKLPVNNEDNAGLYMKNIKFIEEKNKIMGTISEKENNLNEKIMVNDLHINTCQKELNDAVFKYDRAILDNLLIPGLVGKGCKFPNFKEYMSNVQVQLNDAFSKLDFNGDNINKNRKNFENQINQANSKIKKLEYDSKQFTFEKTLDLENKFKQELDSINNNILELRKQYAMNTVDLKSQISSLKNLEKLIAEENRRINFHTLTEFEKIKKGYKYIKKSVIDLGRLLMLSDRRFKGNKNYEANKQLIIEQFNNMMMELMKDTKKEKSKESTKEVIPPQSMKEKEINNKQQTHHKKPVSVIKQYIEGKINAEDTNFNDIDKKKNYLNNKDNNNVNNEENFRRNPNKKKSFFINANKIDEMNLSRLNNINNNNNITNNNINANNINVNKSGSSLDKYKKFSRHASVEYKEINKINNSLISYNNNINNKNSDDIESKKSSLNINNNILENTNKSRHFAIIQEENNNFSNSDDSLFADLDEDFKNLKFNFQANNISYKDNKDSNDNKRTNEEEISLFNFENSFRNLTKKKNKLFLRAVTSNYALISNPKKYENSNDNINIGQNTENFKLLLKAQENAKKKILEKGQSSKDNANINNIKEKKLEKRSTKKFNINAINKDKKKNNNQDFAISRNNNLVIQDMPNSSESQLSYKKEDNIERPIISKKEYNNGNDKPESSELKSEKNIKQNINLNKNKNVNEEGNNANQNNATNIDLIKNKNNIVIEENNKNQITEKVNNNQKEEALLIYKLKGKVDKESLNQNNKNNNFAKTQYRQKYQSPPMNKRKNFSPKENKLTFEKTENNNTIKEKTEREINFSANLKNKYHHNIVTSKNEENKNIPLNLKAIKKPYFNIKESQGRYNNDKIKMHNNFNEDIYLTKDEMKKMNYFKDKDIIDRPLLVNQPNFRVGNIKGSIENKLIELEYFTKKKFDELVKEIKIFIPIHFNAYVKE